MADILQFRPRGGFPAPAPTVDVDGLVEVIAARGVDYLKAKLDDVRTMVDTACRNCNVDWFARTLAGAEERWRRYGGGRPKSRNRRLADARRARDFIHRTVQRHPLKLSPPAPWRAASGPAAAPPGRARSRGAAGPGA